MKLKYLLVFVLAVAIGGCSVFMPYHEDFICNVPEGNGYCGSLSDVYEYSLRTEVVK